jgi:hypothetical protein
MKERDKRKSHINTKLHMIYISSSNVRHFSLNKQLTVGRLLQIIRRARILHEKLSVRIVFCCFLGYGTLPDYTAS